MSRKGQSITLSISERDKQALEALANEFGMTWGDSPNISKLVKAIARHTLQIAPNNDWSQERINTLETARNALVDLGKMPEAIEIAQLLNSRSELSTPLRKEIEIFLNNPQPAWRQKIDDLIQRQQPFRLSYRDAGDRQWNYTVLFAKIEPIEERQYLICRCTESAGNQDLPELSHNWTLRLDRIVEAAVIPIEQTWEKELETVTVEFHLLKGLAFAYRRDKGKDKFISELEGDPPIRRVLRDIHSTFWFFRDIAKYWEDCVIVSPDSVRDRFLTKLKSLNQHYNLE